MRSVSSAVVVLTSFVTIGLAARAQQTTPPPPAAGCGSHFNDTERSTSRSR